jgi:hypothetical protein
MFHKYRSLIPALVLALCSLWTVGAALQGMVDRANGGYGFDLATEHYASFGILTITLISFLSIARSTNTYC